MLVADEEQPKALARWQEAGGTVNEIAERKDRRFSTISGQRRAAMQ